MNTSTVGSAIKKARNENMLTLKQLGERTGKSHAFLSKIENDKVKPTEELITSLSTVLDSDGKLGLLSEIKVLLGHYDEVSQGSDLFKKLHKEGRIEFDDEGDFRLLNKPYYNLNYLLESENDLIYDIKVELFGDAYLSVKLPTHLKDEMYKKMNDIVIKELLKHPEMLDSFDDEKMKIYKNNRTKNYITLHENADEELLNKVIRPHWDNTFLF